MNLEFNLIFTQVRPKTTIGKIIQFSLTRIIIVILFLLPVTILNQIVKSNVGQIFTPIFVNIVNYGLDFATLVLFIIVYGIYTKIVERREPYEFSFRELGMEVGAGFMLSVCLVSLVVIIMYAMGYYKIIGVNPFINLTDVFFAQMMVAFMEELFFRLILFKLTEEFAGSGIALIVQGLLFGFAHAGNPNADLWTTLGLVLSCTFIFGGAFMLTRRIWLIMGIHWGWNFFQSGVFGMPNSGVLRPRWIIPEINGPYWITGGAWGIEVSFIAILLLFLIGIYVYIRAVKNGQYVKPIWIRRKIGGNFNAV